MNGFSRITGDHDGLTVSKNKQRQRLELHSFAYRGGMPTNANLIFDCRFLADPHDIPALQPHTGRDKSVQGFVQKDPNFATYFQRLSDFLEWHLAAHAVQPKGDLIIGFGCVGGQHRSVAVAEIIAHTLAHGGYAVSTHHRELDRQHANQKSDEATE